MSESETRTANAAGGTENNLEALSSFYNIPKELLSATDQNILTILENKIQDYSELQSQNLRLNVKIDEINSLSTTRTDGLKSEIEKLIKENDLIRAERSQIQEQSSQLARDKSSAQHDIEVLQGKLSTLAQERTGLKASKQEIVALLEEKVRELESLRGESQNGLAERKELRKQILELENNVQNMKSRELRDQSEIQTIKQQMAILQKNSHWLEEELTSKIEQLLTARNKSKEEVHRLTSDSMTLKNDLQMEKSRNQVVTTRNEELSQSLQEKLLEIKELSDCLQSEKQEFSREMALKQKLIDLLENQVKSLQDELTASLDRDTSELNDQGGRSAENEKLTKELTELRGKLEASEQERLRLDALIKELLPEEEEADGQDKRSSFFSLRDKDVSLIKNYSDIGILKKELIKERRQKEHLQRQVESFIVELEYKIPVINSFKERSSMLEKELNDVALLLEHTSNEKEKKEREFDALSKKIRDCESSIHILTKQRTDLAHQVQFLLINISVQVDSRGPLSPEEMAFVKRIISSDDPSSDSDSQRVISDRLVEFNNIVTLQNKNMELLKTVRNLAGRLEAEEKDVNKKIQNFENDTIKEAKEAIVTLQDYNTSLESKIEILTKERDAFKALRSENDASGNSQFKMANKNSTSGADEEMVRTLEARLTSVTVEFSHNSKMLNEEIQELCKSKAQVSIELEKEKSSRTLADERLKLVQRTLESTKSENCELVKRSQNLQDILERQDTRTAATVNELIICNSKLAVLETKLSNLETEKNLLQSSERTSRDNYMKLSEERNSLTIMVSQLQTLQSERETLLQEVQNTYKESLDNLEGEKADLKARLDSKVKESEEAENSKRTQIQWYQDKLDSATATSERLKQELHEKTLLADKLQSDNSILEKRLEECDARIQSYKVLSGSESEEASQSSLRRELEKTKINLSEGYAELEHYKDLLSVNEDSLNQLTQEFAKKKCQLEDVTQKLQREKSKLEEANLQLNEKLSNLENSHQNAAKAVEEEKNALMKKISILESTQEGSQQLKENYEAELIKLKEDLEEQASFANRAQRNYEEELQKDSNVSKAISELREQGQKDKLEIERLRVLEEQANKVLQQNEKSWIAQKDEYEKQIDTSRQHIEDLSAQNSLLYDQIELFSKGNGNVERGDHPETREILVNLRRERDILATKLDVSQREEQTLRKSLAAVENELDKTKRQLSQFQIQLTTHSDLIANHDKIMQQLNQLNLLRESNITLRNVSEEANKKNQNMQKEIGELQEKVLPLESELNSLKNSLAQKDQQMNFYKEEINRWKERSQEILRKHDRIDPEDHKQLNEKVTSLEIKLEETSKENMELDDRFNRLKKQAHDKLNNSKISQASLTAEINELKVAKSEIETKFEEEEKKVQELQEKLNNHATDAQDSGTLRIQLTEALDKSKELEQKLNESIQENDLISKKFTAEIDSLKLELINLKERNISVANSVMPENISNIVESMKQSFEEEKINFIKEKTEEFRKLEEERASSSVNGDGKQSSSDYDTLKRQWEDEYEEATLKRISEAEDNLKKRIRLPTEDKIKKIVEKKRTALEEQYRKKLLESKISVDSSDKDPVESENLKKQIEKEMQEKFEEELKLVKKKAFEEGKQQAAMKSTLLERKISKLESQLQSKPEFPVKDSTPLRSNLPSKIDEKSITANKDVPNPLASGEKVLKLDPPRPAFNFQTLAGSNPFTSSPLSNDAASSSAFSLKPTFTLSNDTKNEVTAKDDLQSKENRPIHQFSPSNDDKSNSLEHSATNTTMTPTLVQTVSTPSKRSAEEEGPNALSENKKAKGDNT